ncbi:hypothetical protein CA264_21610 (plasmid) [Pontibacter actiniarum]|uniref:DUF2231 domain-containing protein n=2 Tax=Pontibacter actiniarum TaxID=323450 RepID=A0A1X9YZK8_9BACT|nr:hypothetical protein CA264_21610 [Pontibacter actiniarum]
MLLVSAALYAHVGEKSERSSEAVSSQQESSTGHEQHHQDSSKTEGWDHPENVTADFADFPNLHPLFVHFPVVLLPFAALFQLLGLLYFKREFSGVVLIMVTAGFIGGLVAATFVHPHVGELPAHAQQVYERHDTLATWTLWLSGGAIVLKAGSHFLLHRKRWAEGVVALVLLGAAVTVSMAGHLGSQLAFIEGVGPQGQYLESEGHAH